jgi:hypothetical protein
MAPVDDLKARWGGRISVSPLQAESRNVLPKGVTMYEGGMSLAMRIKAKRIEKERAEREKQDKKKRRRRK